MRFSWILWMVLVVCTEALKEGEEGVCIIKESVTKTRPKTHNVTVPCRDGKSLCIEVQPIEGEFEDYEVELLETQCCDSYDYHPDFDKCVPYCEKSCINGTCVKPNECFCEPPLILDKTGLLHKCIRPVCDQPCINGTCTGNNQCTCKDGYTPRDNFTCIVQCTNCTNGHCDGPNNCKCNLNFIKKGGQCMPQCDDGCSNGICVAPNNCSCNDGYEKKDNKCQPKCNPCKNGDCVSPYTCKCKDGYEAVNGNNENCTPKCKNECKNGFCSAPNNCTCNYGYLPKDNTCIPECKKPCINGECVAPNRCKCLYGYESKGKNGEKCIAKCKDCTNGKCLEPGVCTCNPGYKMEDKICKPVCEKPCVNATCVSPNICACFEGFDKVDDVTCKPKCGLCKHGVCIAPNKCECHPGYSRPDEGCTPICKETCVNGYCSAPNVCSCNSGYTQDALNSSVCYKSCGVCDHGSCKDGECVCDAEMEFINGTCVVSMPSEILGAKNTGLASVQLTWLVGGAVVLLLTVLVLVVISRLWHTRKEIPQKTADDGHYGGSVTYTVANTLFRQDHLADEEEPSDTLLERGTNVV